MPLLILNKVKDGLDPSMKKKAYAFLEKLQEDDSLPGLHIEPIKGSVDPRVRTGRVDDNYRCVLFKIAGKDEPAYVVHGVWPHDKANKIAETVRLSLNPINGMAEVEQAVDTIAAGSPEPENAPAVTASAPVESQVETTPEVAAEVQAPAETSPATKAPTWPADVTATSLHDRLGIDEGLAADALRAPTEEDLLGIIARARVEWQGEALLELATGTPVAEVRTSYGLDEKVDVGDGTEDEQLLASLRHPAAQSSFHWIEDNDELRRIIDAGDLVAWRLFLHPEQQRYVDGNYKGPFRLSGGAGTGKTVVALHRTRRLFTEDPESRILLTTFTRNLADDLARGLRQLDETITLQTHLDGPGAQVKGVDQVVRAVLQAAGPSIAEASASVLGDGRSSVTGATGGDAWREAIDDADPDLPAELTTPAFFQAEYAMVVLPRRITTQTAYIRVRRAGRGVALDRAKRIEVWKVIERYRALGRASDTTDFVEKAALAAAWLELNDRHYFDHVLVDEAQDLNPSQLLFLRALVAVGPNDLFICEDSHQRIYGQKVVLSHVGIQVRGRSRRLTLNYRTTAQNLDWAMHILSGGDFTDLEGENEEHSYHSARSGPVPQLHPAASMSDELDGAAKLVKSWLHADGDDVPATAPDGIAILVRDKYRRQTVVSGLADRGVQVRSVDQENAKPGMPLVMTMHRAKGLEFTHVLLFGVHEGSVPSALKDYKSSEEDFADAMLRERSLLYVAATRARDVLAVSWNGERSSLLD
ncbi:3'-5' exonuclease [Flexivirga sp. B27]